MNGPGNTLSMMRTLLLLNVTQRKLQAEEHILDSSSPLKSLLLHNVAGRLNAHLHDKRCTQDRGTMYRQITDQHQFGTIEDLIEDLNEDDGVLEEMQTALEVGLSCPVNDSETVVEVSELDDECAELIGEIPSDVLMLSEVRHSGSSGMVSEVSEVELAAPPIGAIDLHNLESDFTDMPTLSRQESHPFVPSLYSSDEDEEEDEDERIEDINISRHGGHHYLSSHRSHVTHPATVLFEKHFQTGPISSRLLSV